MKGQDGDQQDVRRRLGRELVRVGGLRPASEEAAPPARAAPASRPGAGLRASVAFDGGVDMIPAARDFAARFLARLRESGTPVAPGREDHAVLVVSELVTNAHRHAPGPCRLELAAADGALRIAVTDTSPEHPRPRPPRPDRIGGHGLEIVLAMCHAIETFDEPGEAGKTVRVTLPLR